MNSINDNHLRTRRDRKLFDPAGIDTSLSLSTSPSVSTAIAEERDLLDRFRIDTATRTHGLIKLEREMRDGERRGRATRST